MQNIPFALVRAVLKLRGYNVAKSAALALSLLLAFSTISKAQTATCTNWNFFKAPSPATQTNASGINRWNVVTGQTAQNTTPQSKGFIRYADGSIKTYLFPSSVWTGLARRNSQGVTVGSYGDSSYNNYVHGLVISGSQTATIDYPGALSTWVTGINYWGSIVGYYFGPTGTINGFELKNGVFTRIHFPGAGLTQAESISDTGVIVGYYENKLSNGALGAPHGFVFAKGTYKTLDDPKGALHYAYGTRLLDINASGVIVGTYHLNGNDYSFLYSNGTFKDIKVPNATTSTADGINGNGYIAGQGFVNGASVGYVAKCQ